MSEHFWLVAVEAPLNKLFLYKSTSEQNIQIGQKIFVPFGKSKKASGVVMEAGILDPQFKSIKNITAIDEEYEKLDEKLLNWLKWISEYYCYPLGQIVCLAYPPLKKSGRATRKSDVIKSVEADKPKALTEQQSKVYQDIKKELEHFRAHLIFGVTGSGKTEIYLQLLEDILAQNKKGLVLVPEISLTPQLTNRFSQRFGKKIAVIHSQLTPREKTNQWWDIVSGDKQILIGARSALFCPIPNLGLIIVDEEHESSFKQEEKLKYHGRDAAIVLAKELNIPIVLGSATPSLESWNNAITDKYKLHTMTQRVENRKLPEIEIIDLKEYKDGKAQIDLDIPLWLSPELHQKIKACLDREEQSALFLNRRGMSNIVLCPACGFVKECPNCDISLTLHAHKHLVCHYCDYHEPYKDKCPDCLEGDLEPMGLGTELIEQDIKRLFPNARVARADRDEIQSRDDLENLITKMESREIDILIGTQMIAKGLDFEKLTLVGLVLADVGFNLPDFRATERSFQLITQVSGRSGRHLDPTVAVGEVVIQTYNPEHVSLQFAKNADFVNFAQQELDLRASLNYPPFGKLISVRLQGLDLEKVQKTADQFVHRAQALKNKFSIYEGIEILGPAESPLSKIKRNYRYQVLLKGGKSNLLNQFTKQVLGPIDWIPAQVKLQLDVDPNNLL